MTSPRRACRPRPRHPFPDRRRRGTAIAAGFTLGRSRLASRGVLVAFLLALSLAMAGATIERSVGAAGAVDRALAGTFGLVVPLLSFWIARVAAGRARLADAAWPAARFGLPRRDVALGIMLAAALAAAALSALSAVAAVLVAHSPSAPPLVRDVVRSAWIAALAAFAYVGWFSFGSTFLRRGGGAVVVLILDFLVGGSTGMARRDPPARQRREPPRRRGAGGLTQPASTAILLASAVAFSLAAALRSGE